MAFIAWTTLALHQRMLQSVFLRILLPGELTFSELLPMYSLYERIAVWFGYGATAVSTVLGFLIYVRNRKHLSSSFLAIVLFLLPIVIIASAIRFLPFGHIAVIVSHRAYEFVYIAIGSLSALFFVRLVQFRKKATPKAAVIGVIMLMILVGPLAGSMHPRTFAMVSRVISVKAITMNTWMSESGATDEHAVGDSVLYLLLVGYGDNLAFRYSELFVGPDFDLPFDIQSKARYVVTYTYMTDFYGSNAAKFYASPYFHNVYANGVLNVFRIANRTSS